MRTLGVVKGECESGRDTLKLDHNKSLGGMRIKRLKLLVVLREIGLNSMK